MSSQPSKMRLATEDDLKRIYGSGNLLIGSIFRPTDYERNSAPTSTPRPPAIPERSRPDFPLGDALEVFIRREDAERFIEEVRGDESQIAAKLRIEERELEADGRN